MHLIMADQGGSSSSSVRRDYMKGNWTVSETMVLIEAKKMDDERRMKRSEETSEPGRSSKPTELRWKWIEDYCWRKGCLRSQNQCNDKWDNIMRDYKKVRDYERRIAERSGEGDGNYSVSTVAGSYWILEKNERKEKNLPSNMLPQIYQALAEVVEKKGTHHKILNVGGGGGGSSAPNPNIAYVVQPSLPPLLMQHHQVSGSIPLLPIPPALPPPPPPQQPPVAQPAAPLSYYPHQSSPTVGERSDSDTSEYSDSPAKRRRRKGRGGGGGGGEGTSKTANTRSSSHEVGSAISKSASIIAEALQACDERQERRHRDLLSIHERRLEIEESRTEINRQDINGLVNAINKLANSILALASNSKNQSSSK